MAPARNSRHLRFVEPLIFGSDAVDDYKIFCFEGYPRIIQVDLHRFSNHMRKFFDTAWNELNFSIVYPRAPVRRFRQNSRV